MNVLPSRRSWLASVASLAAGSPFAAAQPPKGKDGAPAPVAMLVALDDYDAQPLQYPVKSCVALAKRLRQYGYAVTLLTDAKSTPAATAELKGVAAVEEVGDGPALERRAKQWVATTLGYSKARPHLGILVFSGHGETRGGRQFVLTKGDKPGAGGADVDAVKDVAAESGLPMVVVVDACRTGADPAGAAQVRLPGRGKGVVIGKGSVEHEVLVTTLYASQQGRIAPDTENDLVRNLADALAFDPAKKQFKAQLHRFPAADRAWHPTGPQELTLKTWFYAATNDYRWDNELKPYGWDSGRLTPLSTTIVASYNPAPKGGALARMGGPKVGDLLRDVGELSGGFAKERFGPAVRFTRTPDSKIPFGWGGVELKTPVEAAGKTLVVEVMSEGVKSIQVHAKSRGGGVETVLTTAPAAHLYPVTDRTPTVVLIPLTGVEGKKLNVIGISTDGNQYDSLWPEGASLTITGMRLADTAGLDPKKLGDSIPAAPRNLLEGWWHNDTPPDNLKQLKATPAEVNKQPALRLSDAPAGEAGWRGGPVEPPAFLSGGAAVVVKVKSDGGKPGAKVTVKLHAGEDIVASLDVDVSGPAGEKSHRVVVEKPAAVDYMTVTSAEGSVALISVTATAAKGK